MVTLVNARRFHPSQRLVRHADGRASLHLDAPLTPELLQWVVGWGPTVEVIAPPALRQQVRAEHQQAAALYASDPPARRRPGRLT